MNYKAIRKTYKLSQFEMAKEVGVNVSTWRKWEAGNGCPNDDNVKKIKQAKVRLEGKSIESQIDELQSSGLWDKMRGKAKDLWKNLTN